MLGVLTSEYTPICWQEWDKVVSTFLLREAIGSGASDVPADAEDGRKGSNIMQATFGASARVQNQQVDAPGVKAKKPEEPWCIDKMQQYIAWVHETCPTATLSSEAEVMLLKGQTA